MFCLVVRVQRTPTNDAVCTHARHGGVVLACIACLRPTRLPQSFMQQIWWRWAGLHHQLVGRQLRGVNGLHTKNRHYSSARRIIIAPDEKNGGEFIWPTPRWPCFFSLQPPVVLDGDGFFVRIRSRISLSHRTIVIIHNSCYKSTFGRSFCLICDTLLLRVLGLLSQTSRHEYRVYYKRAGFYLLHNPTGLVNSQSVL